MKRRILEYEHPSGACPVTAFVDSLDARTQEKIYRQLVRLQDVEHVLQPPMVKLFRTCRRKGLYELRICTGQAVRLMFYIHSDGSIVLLYGFSKKKEQATDKAFEIAGARRLALASGKARIRPVQNGLTEETQ